MKSLTPTRVAVPLAIFWLLIWFFGGMLNLYISTKIGLTLLVLGIAFVISAYTWVETPKKETPHERSEALIAAAVAIALGLIFLFAHRSKLPQEPLLFPPHVQQTIVHAGFSLQEGCDSQEEGCSKAGVSPLRMTVRMILIAIALVILFLPKKGGRGQIPPF